MRPQRILVATSAMLLAGLAVAAPASAESCGKVTYADGTVGPSVCPDGMPNEKVKKAYEKSAPTVMALQSSTTRSQLKAAVRKDCSSQGATKPMVYDAIEYQAARYDWRRSMVNAVVRNLVNGNYC